MLNKLYR